MTMFLVFFALTDNHNTPTDRQLASEKFPLWLNRRCLVNTDQVAGSHTGHKISSINAGNNKDPWVINIETGQLLYQNRTLLAVSPFVINS